jgi:hypothetical protein
MDLVRFIRLEPTHLIPNRPTLRGVLRLGSGDHVGVRPGIGAAFAEEEADPCGWDPSRESDNSKSEPSESKSEQVRQCMDLEHCLHWLHLEPTHLICMPTTLCARKVWRYRR